MFLRFHEVVFQGNKYRVREKTECFKRSNQREKISITTCFDRITEKKMFSLLLLDESLHIAIKIVEIPISTDSVATFLF